MKLTLLGFQQQKLIDNGLDIKDAVILRNILDRYASMKMESVIVDNDRYIWINWSSFMQDIPLVINNKKTLEARIKKFSDEGLIVREIRHKKDGRGGTFVYVKPTEKLDDMSEHEAPPKNEGYHPSKNRDTTPQKIGNKDYSINDSSIKDIYTKEVYDYWLLKAKHINNAKYTDGLVKELDKAIKKYSKDNILQAIDNYVEVFDSDYYYSAAFTLINFLKQSNCIPRFIEGVDEKYNGDIYKGYKIKFPSMMNTEKPYWANIDS